MVWVVGNPCDAAGVCRGSGHGSDAPPDDATQTEMSDIACRCSCGQVKVKLNNFEGWTVILPPARGSWSMFLKATEYFSHWWLRALGYFSYGCFVEGHHHLKSYGVHQLPKKWWWLLAASCDRGYGLHIILRFSGLGDTPEMWVSLKMFRPKPAPVGAHWGARAEQCSRLAPHIAAADQPPRENTANPSTHSSNWSGHFHLVEETEGRKCVCTVLRWKLL